MKSKSTNASNTENIVQLSTRIGGTLTKTLVLGGLVAALTTAASQAVVRLTFEMRAVQTGINAANVSNGATISPDGFNVSFAPSGGSVVLQLVATLNNQNGILTDDSITRVDGSFVSAGSTPGLMGLLRAGSNTVEPFATGTGAKSGSPLELSGTAIAGGTADQILDVGGNSTTAFTGYFTASGPLTGQVGQSFILGETVLTLSSPGTTSVRFVPRLGVGGLGGNRVAATFKLDNVNYSLNGDGSGTGGSTDAFSFGNNPLSITVVPEPSAFVMVILGSLGVIGSRRLGLRKN